MFDVHSVARSNPHGIDRQHIDFDFHVLGVADFHQRHTRADDGGVFVQHVQDAPIDRGRDSKGGFLKTFTVTGQRVTQGGFGLIEFVGGNAGGELGGIQFGKRHAFLGCSRIVIRIGNRFFVAKHLGAIEFLRRQFQSFAASSGGGIGLLHRGLCRPHSRFRLGARADIQQLRIDGFDLGDFRGLALDRVSGFQLNPQHLSTDRSRHHVLFSDLGFAVIINGDLQGAARRRNHVDGDRLRDEPVTDQRSDRHDHQSPKRSIPKSFHHSFTFKTEIMSKSLTSRLTYKHDTAAAIRMIVVEYE